jgi:hypothetical protein
MGVAEEHIDPGIDAELVVTSHFFALVPRQRFEQLLRDSLCCLGQPFGDVFSGFVVDLDQHPESGGPFHKCGDCRPVAFTDDQVAFPMPRNSPILHLRWSF